MWGCPIIRAASCCDLPGTGKGRQHPLPPPWQLTVDPDLAHRSLMATSFAALEMTSPLDWVIYKTLLAEIAFAPPTG